MVKTLLKLLALQLYYFTEIEGGNIVPGVEDICASYQYALTKHLVRQTHKAMIYASVRELLPTENQTLVCIFSLFLFMTE